MESNPNLPAERVTTAIVEPPASPPSPDPAEEGTLEGRQNVWVAVLPLALVAFIVLAIVVASWTFLAAAGA